MHEGDPVSVLHAQTVIRDEYDNNDVRYIDAQPLAPPLLLEDTREEMRHCTEGREYWDYRWIPGTVESAVTATRLGPILARRLALSAPVGLLAHRDRPPDLQTIRRSRLGFTHLTLFFRTQCFGGEMILPERKLAFVGQDGWCLSFDAQELHGLAPIRRHSQGWHCAVTFFCPKESA